MVVKLQRKHTYPITSTYQALTRQSKNVNGQKPMVYSLKKLLIRVKYNK